MILRSSYNGSRIKGDAVMLSKYGDVYNAIDNAYHPNPGSREDGYAEIERCIDWLIENKFTDIEPIIMEWMSIRIAQYLMEEQNPDEDIDYDELVKYVMFSDIYDVYLDTEDLIKSCTETLIDNGLVEDYCDRDETVPAEKIADYINEKFLRIRAGGKLNPEGTDSIYFRISSHGYDWHREIVDFLWRVFRDPKKMPSRIWIGHDAETNPPEVTLFDGTPDELFETFDDKKFEEFKGIETRIKLEAINRDRKAQKLNKYYLKTNVENSTRYQAFI